MKACITLLIVVVSVLHSVLCYRYTNVHSLHGILDRKDRSFSNRDTEQLLQPSPFTIVEVQRQTDLEDNLNKFTVIYESTLISAPSTWRYVLAEPGASIFDLDNGMYESSAWATAPEEPNFWNYPQGVVLTLSTPDKRERVEVGIYNIKEDGIVTEIPVPRLDVEPEGDYGYQEGEDLTFKVRVQESMYSVYNYEKEGYTYYDLWIRYFLLDLDTGIVELKEMSHYSDPDLLKNEKYADFQEFSMKLNTSVNRISGVIAVDFSMRNHFSGVIESVERIKDVILRPSTQAGPLPDGFLRFGITEDQPQTLYTGFGEECTYRCVAVGQDITEMKVERLRSDGTVELLGDPNQSMGRFWDSLKPYVQEENVKFHVHSLPEGPEKIRCTAKNAEGKVIIMEIPLIAYERSTIIGEESSVELINDQDDPTVKKFTAMCTAKGDPQPTISFIVTTWDGRKFRVIPDETVVTGDMTYKSIANFSIDADELEGSPFPEYLGVDCLAEQESPVVHYDSYSMLYPPN